MSGKGKQAKAKMPFWKQLLLALSVGASSIGGGTGVVALVDAFQGPEVTPMACPKYYDEVGDLHKEGFKGFQLMKDKELEERCGDAVDVDKGWDADG